MEKPTKEEMREMVKLLSDSLDDYSIAELLNDPTFPDMMADVRAFDPTLADKVALTLNAIVDLQTYVRTRFNPKTR
jgi:hypothetical protein